MGSNLGNAVPTACIKFPSFNLSSALEADHKARMAAEDAGEPLDDGEVEFEDEVDEEVCMEPVPPADLSSTLPLASRNDKKYAKLTKRSRAKQAAEAVERVVSRGVKPFVVKLAKGALPLELEDFDASALPVFSSGWNANPRKKLFPGLQRSWAVFLMGLKGRNGGQWKLKLQLLLRVAVNQAPSLKHRNMAGVEILPRKLLDMAMAMAGANHKTTKSPAGGTRMPCKSFFETRQFGTSQAFKTVCVARVSLSEDFEHQRNSSLALFNTFCHKNYAEYRDTNDEMQLKQPELRPNFRNTAFAATTFNLGPLSFSPPHMDPDNRASSWCADTNMGPFDPDKGGHLVLIICFPPGSTILFPSALITHSTIPIQAHETRYAMIQYSSGGLFRWRNNGFQSDKSFLEHATAEEHVEREASRAPRWKLGLQKFTRWGDVCKGDWRGTVRTAAGLDEDKLSDPADILDDLEESHDQLEVNMPGLGDAVREVSKGVSKKMSQYSRFVEHW
ncbi:hypothetical protein LENED_009614 [Lentinula edodes]|uniref:Uncharacterized protein n=1 Tax=Lentinula edodes TaxID=5353 RepID=A0A1Q3EKB4_LENED|nr:hypothetical protein LENED_009614 [Lentinula edodes]